MKKEMIAGGNDCPKCSRSMQRYQHQSHWRPPTPRSYFRFWDVCHPCRHIQHYEEARVLPHGASERLNAIKEQLREGGQ